MRKRAPKQASKAKLYCVQPYTETHTTHSICLSRLLLQLHALALTHALSLANPHSHPHALAQKQPSGGEVVPVARKDEKTRIFFLVKTRMSCFCVELLWWCCTIHAHLWLEEVAEGVGKQSASRVGRGGDVASGKLACLFALHSWS